MSKDRRYPIGTFVFNAAVTPELRDEYIRAIAELPRHLRGAVAPSTDRQLETPYREGGWTVRQVVHHVVDSHINAYVRFRWALTEDAPTLKAYDEKAWAELPDAKVGRVALSLDLLSALHARWVTLLEAMGDEDFARVIMHPESGPQPLDRFLQLYAWHGRHHLAHVLLVTDPLGNGNDKGVVLTQRERMLAGELYDPVDSELTEARERARDLCQALNATREVNRVERQRLMRELLGTVGADAMIQPPFHCDYGVNITLGMRVFFNFNCVVLDVCHVRIGDYTMFGPAVQIYTATHPLDAPRRRQLEYGKPVVIGDDVWVGGGAIICPGVTIGSRSVIGAGSVVTRDVPDDAFAAGNPCRVIRAI